jgi:hypothetical protein
VRLGSGEKRRYSMYYSKRYDEERLVRCIAQEGWDLVRRWRYGSQEPQHVLYLLRKRAQP